MESTPATRREPHTVGACRGSIGRHVWAVSGQGRREGRRRASIFSVTLQRSSWVLSVHGSSAYGASGGDGGGCGGLGGGDGGG
eukprot:scaffold33425_cov62-Phaeocystis_antarctica.AAC.1